VSKLPDGFYFPVNLMDWVDNADDASMSKTVLAEVTSSEETTVEIAVHVGKVTRFLTFNKADLREVLES